MLSRRLRLLIALLLCLSSSLGLRAAPASCCDACLSALHCPMPACAACPTPPLPTPVATRQATPQVPERPLAQAPAAHADPTEDIWTPPD